jgi:ferredoxin
VEHGHQAAISIHNHCQGIPVDERPRQNVTLASTKMGLHEWAYSNDYSPVARQKMHHVEMPMRFSKMTIEVEQGFTAEQTAAEVERCLNCDVQTHFTAPACIECDACVDICPTDCLTIAPNGDEANLRSRLTAPSINPEQPLFVSAALKQTARVMVKDENICVHCGLCAERCPTYAWDMRRSVSHIPHAGEPVTVPALAGV